MASIGGGADGARARDPTASSETGGTPKKARISSRQVSTGVDKLLSSGEGKSRAFIDNWLDKSPVEDDPTSPDMPSMASQSSHDGVGEAREGKGEGKVPQCVCYHPHTQIRIMKDVLLPPGPIATNLNAVAESSLNDLMWHISNGYHGRKLKNSPD